MAFYGEGKSTEPWRTRTRLEIMAAYAAREYDRLYNAKAKEETVKPLKKRSELRFVTRDIFGDIFIPTAKRGSRGRPHSPQNPTSKSSPSPSPSPSSSSSSLRGLEKSIMKRPMLASDDEQSQTKIVKKPKKVNFETDCTSSSHTLTAMAVNDDERRNDAEEPDVNLEVGCSSSHSVITMEANGDDQSHNAEETNKVNPRGPPAWLAEEMRRRNGDEPRMIMEKTLFRSDIDKGLSRLLIPFKKVVDKDFLREGERRSIDELYEQSKVDKSKKSNAFQVDVVDSSSRSWVLGLKRWDMNKKDTGNFSANYSLQTKWNSVVEANRFKVGDVLELWSFRVEGKLCLAVFTR